MKEAAILDQKLAQERKSGQYNLLNLPLIGVPFSAKDCCPVAGMKMIAGFAPRKDIKAETKDAECIGITMINLFLSLNESSEQQIIFYNV